MLPTPVFLKYVRKLAEKIIHQRKICKTCVRNPEQSVEPPSFHHQPSDKNAVTVNNYS